MSERVIPSRFNIERENIRSTCKHFKYVSLNVAHSPKWSNGKAAFFRGQRVPGAELRR